ncbi:MAG: flagellin FliC [Oligoflexia bacterium]|nr:flagellin FliC [Oligoflexia bacterium]MBF0364790.1 flagellin FliC [Oligoflexia bacterium]
MGLRISTNVSSLSAQRHLTKVSNDQRGSLERLASGTRIVRAGDDAAGLAISEKLKTEIRGSIQAERNANDGISFIQTAEGGLSEISDIFVRLKELSVQSASDTVGDQERAFSNLEYQSLLQEVNRIAYSTEFNGKRLLTGEGELLEFQVGTKNDPSLDRMNFNPSNAPATVEKLGMEGTNISTKQDAQMVMDRIDSSLVAVNGNRASLGALQNRLLSTVRNLQVKTENLSEANSRIRDSDIAVETSDLTKSNILSAAGSSVLAQANNSSSTALKLIG